MRLPVFAFAAGCALAVVPFTAQARVERVVEKSFHVAPGGLLVVETQGGNIRVDIGDGETVKVIAKKHFRTSSESEADAVEKDLSLEIDQAGNDVTAISKYQASGARSFWGGGSLPVQVEFSVTVPAQYRGKLRTSGGNIEVGDLAGDLEASTSGGNVAVGRIEGQVDVRTSGGRIQVTDAKRDLKAHTSGGDVQVGAVGGTAEVSTSGGNIHIDSASGALDAHTSGGNVTARFLEAFPRDCSLRTSGGNVHVTVSPKSAFRLQARTSGGSVRLDDLPIEIEEGGNGKSRLSGRVNGGGASLLLRTSGGNIRIASSK